jgi:hypothetical protein
VPSLDKAKKLLGCPGVASCEPAIKLGRCTVSGQGAGIRPNRIPGARAGGAAAAEPLAAAGCRACRTADIPSDAQNSDVQEGLAGALGNGPAATPQPGLRSRILRVAVRQ